jgi:hypothetical protein
LTKTALLVLLQCPPNYSPRVYEKAAHRYPFDRRNYFSLFTRRRLLCCSFRNLLLSTPQGYTRRLCILILLCSHLFRHRVLPRRPFPIVLIIYLSRTLQSPSSCPISHDNKSTSYSVSKHDKAENLPVFPRALSAGEAGSGGCNSLQLFGRERKRRCMMLGIQYYEVVSRYQAEVDEVEDPPQLT